MVNQRSAYEYDFPPVGAVEKHVSSLVPHVPSVFNAAAAAAAAK